MVSSHPGIDIEIHIDGRLIGYPLWVAANGASCDGGYEVAEAWWSS